MFLWGGPDKAMKGFKVEYLHETVDVIGGGKIFVFKGDQGDAGVFGVEAIDFGIADKNCFPRAAVEMIENLQQGIRSRLWVFHIH